MSWTWRNDGCSCLQTRKCFSGQNQVHHTVGGSLPELAWELQSNRKLSWWFCILVSLVNLYSIRVFFLHNRGIYKNIIIFWTLKPGIFNCKNRLFINLLFESHKLTAHYSFRNFQFRIFIFFKLYRILQVGEIQEIFGQLVEEWVELDLCWRWWKKKPGHAPCSHGLNSSSNISSYADGLNNSYPSCFLGP